MHILIDAILILVFIITVIHYYRVGFVKALFSVCKLFLAVVIAFTLASPVGAFISEKFISEPIKNTTNEIISGIEIDQKINVAEFIEQLPSAIKTLISSSDTLNEWLEGGSLETPINDEIIERISNSISGKLSTIISSIIAFLIIFALSMILLTFLAFVLDKICMLPVLKQTNKLLGIALGAVFGICHVFIASTVITLVLHLVGIKYPDLAVNVVSNRAIVYYYIENIDLSKVIINFFKLG